MRQWVDPPNSIHRYRRRGSMYMMVLGCTMLVAIIGLTAASALRVELKTSTRYGDFTQARLLARSAFDWGFQQIKSDTNWRTNFPSGEWIHNQPMGTGMFSLYVTDPLDADLTDSVDDPLLLRGVGMQNDTRYELQVTMVSRAKPLECLGVALQSGSHMTYTSAVVNSDRLIASNANMASTDSIINTDVETYGSINGSGYMGSAVSGAARRSMPDPAEAFTYYMTNGTYIDSSLLPTDATGDPVLANVLLSPTSNPFGAPNPKGIYIIDSSLKNVTITNCRIVGTIVLPRPGPDSKITGAIHWEAAIENFPILMVDGQITFNFDASIPLSESVADPSTANFNPPSTPYLGVWDDDLLDTYPTVMRGLVYCADSANTLIGSHAKFEGVLVVGATTDLSGSVSLSYRSIYWNDPPPGFRDTPQMVVAPRSWRRIVR